uniref:Insulin-like domain-containing protein n=1 Tax=Ciona savignyi TaxID=51511 RepID=H2Z5E8_CIOSA
MTCNLDYATSKRIAQVILMLIILDSGWAGRRYRTAIRSFPRCGSRMVNDMRYMCLQNMWEETVCLTVSRRLCRGGISRHPICRFDCTATSRQKRFMDRNDDTGSLFITPDIGSSGARLNITSPAVNNPTARGPNHKMLMAKRRRREKRFIARRCCSSVCSLSVLRQFCHGLATE